MLATGEQIEGKEHPDTLTTANSLGAVLIAVGKCREAEKVLAQTLAPRKKAFGIKHEDTLMVQRCENKGNTATQNICFKKGSDSANRSSERMIPGF